MRFAEQSLKISHRITLNEFALDGMESDVVLSDFGIDDVARADNAFATVENQFNVGCLVAFQPAIIIPRGTDTPPQEPSSS